MENPRVSIIIPTYNGEKFVSKTIKSVLQQTFKDFELIIVDDCSSDNTVSIIKEWQKKDGRIKFFKLDRRSGGPEEPRNVGIKNSKSNYIFFLDHDDMLLPNSIEERFKIFLKNDYDIIDATCFVVDRKKGKIIDYVSGITPSLAIRKDLFDEKKVGLFNEKAKGIGEPEWFARYLCFKNNTPNVFYFEKPTILYFRDDNQMSFFNHSPKTIEKFLRMKFALLESLLTQKREYVVNFLSSTYFWIAHYYALLGDFEKSISYFKVSLSIKPNFLTCFLYFIALIRSHFLYKKSEKFLRWFKKTFIKPFRLNYLKSKYPDLYKQSLKLLNKE